MFRMITTTTELYQRKRMIINPEQTFHLQPSMATKRDIYEKETVSYDMGVKPNNNQKISQLEKCFESQQIENEIPKRRNIIILDLFTFSGY